MADPAASVERFDCTNGGAAWCQGCYTMTRDDLGDYVRHEDYEALRAKYDSAINTLKDIAAMGRKAGSESARHRLIQLGIDVPDYGSMT